MMSTTALCSSRSSSSQYRPEIDGLRAVAVLAVMLCHAEVPGLAGGFLGVDIFFVISGYLMTGIVLAGEAAGGLKLTEFYLRRVRRILPALLLVALVSAPVAWAIMVPDLLENFGQSLVATVLMANNLLLWLTGGYWEINAGFKPLMHTWSLAVEEQFYLVGIPVMLFALRRGGSRMLWVVLVAGAILSFLLAVWLQAADQEARFLFLPSRAWELAAGGLAALARPRLKLVDATGQVGGWSGLAAIALAIAGGNSRGIGGTLTAVAGAALFLVSANHNSGAGWLLARRTPVAIGLASYSAYLIHQPLLAFVRLVSLERPGTAKLLTALLPVLPLALLCWAFVERPMRDGRRIGDRAAIVICATGSLFLMAVGLTFHHSHGFADAWPQVSQPGTSNIAYVQRNYAYANRALDPARHRDNVLFVGDSFARDAINMALDSHSVSGLQIGYVEAFVCDGGPDVKSLARKADTVVLAYSLAASRTQCLVALVDAFTAAGVPNVVLLGPKAFAWSNSAVMLLPTTVRLDWRSPVDDQVQAVDQILANHISGAHYISLVSLMGQKTGNLPVFTPQGQFISQDGRHLTPAGAAWLGRIVFAQRPLRHLRRNDAKANYYSSLP